jgi:hypothetical protein
MMKQRERSVGGDCYHTIFMFGMKFNFIPIIGAMAIAPYEYDNMQSSRRK